MWNEIICNVKIKLWFIKLVFKGLENGDKFNVGLYVLDLLFNFVWVVYLELFEIGEIGVFYGKSIGDWFCKYFVWFYKILLYFKYVKMLL